MTNAQFKKFLDATHYAPRDAINFLRDWKNGTFPAGLGKPAGDVGVAGRCARLRGVGRQAAAARVGVAVGGARHGRPRISLGQPRGMPAERSYARDWAAPCADRTRSMRIPQGASPYGVMDMVGNVWQWTDEFIDEHTRAAIVRGGEYYQPQGSIWYFPQA